MKSILQRLARDIRLLLGIGRTADLDDSQGIQLMTVDMGNGEMRTARRYQDYGLSSAPPNDSRVVTGSIGGRRSFLVALRADHPDHRPRNLKRGETILYTTFGDCIHLREGRVVYIKAGTQVTVDAPLAEFAQDVVINRNLLVKGETTLQNNLVQTAGNMQTAGNVAAQGNVAADGDMSSGGTITAETDVVSGDISLKHHRTPYRADGNDKISGEPVP